MQNAPEGDLRLANEVRQGLRRPAIDLPGGKPAKNNGRPLVKPAMIGVLVMTCLGTSQGSITLVSRNEAKAVIIAQPGATAAEGLALQELRRHIAAVTGVELPIQSAARPGEAAIVVGPGPVASTYFPDVPFGDLGLEGIAIRTAGNKLLIAGGRPRGTLYAVSRFLQDQLGIRWWTPWAAKIPKRSTLAVASISLQDKPAFESRDPFWFPAFDAFWAIRNGSNSQHSRITPDMGGKISYKGFVHTFFALVPPAEHFAKHPEWYSLVNGKRTAEYSQLCTTNPELREYVVQRVREWLKEAPDARIVSISQNDWAGPCQCPQCKAVDDREGSYSGTMVEFLNHIAAKLGPEFPDVAFDTLAYQYTRKAPSSIRPLPNVIIRLCSIECNFAAPLTDPSNAAFARDIVAWSRICDRLYVWDYTTDFAHYVMPHPNYFSLGPNVRFFSEHGVKGLFEQGAYQSFGSEMSELRAWVLARLLWNPQLDDRKLINEFLDGYYGRGPARHIREYMRLMSRAAKGFYMGCFTSPNAPYLRYAVLARAEALLAKAEAEAGQDADLVWRVRQARLAVWYAWLVRWSQLRRECLTVGGEWPVPASRRALADLWLAAATGPGPQGWSRMTHVNEGGLTPEQFVSRFAEDPPEPKIAPLPERSRTPEPPSGLTAKGAVDVQDSLARLAGEWTWAETRADPSASDGVGVYLPSNHHEWAFQVHWDKLPRRARSGRWHVYALIRVDGARPEASGTAFTAGVWDSAAGADLGGVAVPASDASATYRPYLLATVDTRRDRYVWVAPAANPSLTGVWVDRLWLVPAR